jgi:hypothetical protein
LRAPAAQALSATRQHFLTRRGAIGRVFAHTTMPAKRELCEILPGLTSLAGQG